MHARRYFLVLIIACGCVLSDFASKSWAGSQLILGKVEPLIPGLLQLRLATNTGGAFSLGAGHGELMTLVVCLFTTGIIYWIRHRLSQPPIPLRWEQAGMGFLLGGALGNLLSRLTAGKVIDFLDFAFINFPVFNLADVFIDIGLLLIIICTYLPHQAPTTPRKAD